MFIVLGHRVFQLVPPHVITSKGDLAVFCCCSPFPISREGLVPSQRHVLSTETLTLFPELCPGAHQMAWELCLNSHVRCWLWLLDI